MKKDDLSVMDAIYRNADMGSSSTKSIMKKVTDSHLRAELEKQLEYYNNSLQRIESNFSSRDNKPNELNPMVKAWAKIDLEMQTMVGCDSSKIAQLMIEGTNMGIIEIEKSLNSNRSIPDDIHTHAKSVIEHEKKYIEALKAYL